MTAVRLAGLEIENVKKIRAVSLRLEGDVTVLEGKNAQGKTSVIDSIWYALGGSSSHPPEVVRRGAEKARALLDFSDFTVERKWTTKSTQLYVTMKDGKRVASPQSFLDALVGPNGLAFDPLAFLTRPKAEQLEVVRKLGGLDFTALDAKRQTAFDARAEVARVGKDLRARVQAFAPLPADLPERPVDVDELLAEQGRRQALRNGNDQIRASLTRLEQDRRRLEDDLAEAEEEVERVEKVLADARETQERRGKAFNELVARHEADAKRVADLVDPNVDEITTQLRGAQGTNLAIMRRNERGQLEQELAAKLKEHAGLEREIEECDVEKRRMLREAKFPIDGLGFSLEGLTFKDLPFPEQASQAEQIRVVMAIAFALNPKLKLALIRNASLVDAAGLALIAELTTKAGGQVVLERVAEQPGAGFYIQDGELLDAEVAA